MVDKRILGALVIIVLATAIYVSVEGVRIRVDQDASTIYVYENRWLIGGVEYNKLFSGTKLVYRNLLKSNWNAYFDEEQNTTTIIRETVYRHPNVPRIVDTYFIDGKLTAKEKFPVSHSVEIWGGKGLIYQYEVRRLTCNRETEKGVTSPQSFGKNMKVEWSDGYYYSKVYRYANKNECKLLVKYRITEDYVRLEQRLFDPPTLGLTFNGTAAATYVEIGHVVNITGTSDNASASVCLTIDHPDLGTNYTCGVNGSIEALWTAICGLNKFNDSSTSNTLTFGGGDNQTAYVTVDKYAEAVGLNFNVTNESIISSYQVDATGSAQWCIGSLLNCAYAADNDWGTYTNPSSDGTTVYVYENWTIPSAAYSLNSTVSYLEVGATGFDMEYYNGSAWVTMPITIATTAQQETRTSTEIVINSDMGSTYQTKGILVRNDGSSILGRYYEANVTWNSQVNPTNLTFWIANEKENVAYGELIGTNIYQTDVLSNNESLFYNWRKAGVESAVLLLDNESDVTSVEFNLTGDYTYELNYTDTFATTEYIDNSSTTALWNGTTELYTINRTDEIKDSQLTATTTHSGSSLTSMWVCQNYTVPSGIDKITRIDFYRYVNFGTTYPAYSGTYLRLGTTYTGGELYSEERSYYNYGTDTKWESMFTNESISVSENDIIYICIEDFYSTWNHPNFHPYTTTGNPNANGYLIAGGTDYTDEDLTFKIYGETASLSQVVISNVLYEPSVSITSATINYTSENDTFSTVELFLSANNGVNWENVTDNMHYTFTNTGTQLKWKAEINSTNLTSYSNITDIQIQTGEGFPTSSFYPTNVSVDIGCDGNEEVFIDGELNTSILVYPAEASVDDYLDSCDKYCSVPVCFGSKTAGILNITGIEVNYTLEPSFNETAIQAYLDDDTLCPITDSYDTTCNVPIDLYSDTAGNLTIDTLNLSYYGWQNLTVTVESEGTTLSRYLYLAYSKFTESLPTDVSHWVVYPKSYTQENVTPYGQDDDTPIWYINGSNYKMAFNISYRLNETLSCINITASNDSAKANGSIMNTTYQDISMEIGVFGNASIWQWIDLNACNASGLRFWDPTGYFQAVCSECI